MILFGSFPKPFYRLGIFKVCPHLTEIAFVQIELSLDNFLIRSLAKLFN